MTFLLLTLLALPQEARELVEKLRSESVVERQDAARRLKELGEAARPVLEQAANDPDGEVATRARHLLRLLGARKYLTPAFRKAFPEAEEEFSVDQDLAALKFLPAAIYRDPPLARSDLDPLAAGALRACRSAEEKQQVLEIVSRHHLRGAAPALLPMLEDPDSEVREQALDAALRFGLRIAAPQLEGFLANGNDREIRRKAAQALLELRSPDALPRFTQLLEDPDLDVREKAVEALADMGARDVIPELLRAVAKSRRGTGLTALHGLDARDRLALILADLAELPAHPFLLPILEDWRPKEAIAPLIQALHGKESHRAAAAAELLGAMRAKEAAADLLPLLERDERMVVQSASEALVLLDAREAAPAAAKLMGSSSALHREAGARLLRGLGARSAARDVLPHLFSPEAEVRKGAARLLHEWQAVETVDDLLKEAERLGPEIARESLDLLGRLRAKAAVPLLERLALKPGFESAAADALARIGEPEAVPLLLRRLQSSSDPLDRLRALRGLSWLRPSSAAEAVDSVLADRDPDLRIAAIQALLEIDRSKALARAVERLNDDDWRVREAALVALSRHPRADAGPSILPLLEDPEERVRPAALRAAAAAATPGVVPALRKTLGSTRPEDVWAAIEACERLGSKETLPDLEGLYRKASGEADPEMDRLAARAVWAYARGGGKADLPFMTELWTPSAEAQKATYAVLGFLRAAPSERFLLREFPVPGRGPNNDILARALGALESKDGLARVFEEVERGSPGSGRLLREFDARDRIPSLVGLLRHRSAAVRQESLEALAALGARESWREFVPLLKDRHPDVRKAAASGLGVLSVPDSATELLAVPLEGSAVAWRAAARALCRMGRRERAAILLGESPFELNALREPETWKRLQATPLREDLTGTPIELLRSILAQAGLSLDVSEGVEFAREDSRIRWIWPRKGRISLLDAIEEVFDVLPPARWPRMILERDRLRLLAPGEARWRWEAWWAETSK